MIVCGIGSNDPKHHCLQMLHSSRASAVESRVRMTHESRDTVELEISKSSLQLLFERAITV